MVSQTSVRCWSHDLSSNVSLLFRDITGHEVTLTPWGTMWDFKGLHHFFVWQDVKQKKKSPVVVSSIFHFLHPVLLLMHGRSSVQAWNGCLPQQMFSMCSPWKHCGWHHKHLSALLFWVYSLKHAAGGVMIQRQMEIRRWRRWRWKFEAIALRPFWNEWQRFIYNSSMLRPPTDVTHHRGT